MFVLDSTVDNKQGQRLAALGIDFVRANELID